MRCNEIIHIFLSTRILTDKNETSKIAIEIESLYKIKCYFPGSALETWIGAEESKKIENISMRKIKKCTTSIKIARRDKKMGIIDQNY